MRAIAHHLGVSRNTIRRALAAAGVAARPAGRPRLPVSSDQIAHLRESGYSWVDISEQLQINPEAARTRYQEVRSRRGTVRRGRWHQILLTALNQQPTVVVLATAATHLGREPTSNEAYAARRAARDLANAGDAQLDHKLLTRRGRQANYVVLSRPLR